MRSRVVALTIALCVVSSGQARAAPPDAPTSDAKELAAQRFSAGKLAFGRGEFAAAAAAFEQAALYAPHPATDLNAAEAWELSGDPVRAAEICDRVLVSASPESRFHEVAARQLARLASKVATLDIRGTAGTRAAVDNEPGQVLPRKVRVAPGTHRVAVDGAVADTRRMTVIVAAGETKSIDAFAEAAAPERAAPAGSSPGPPLATVIAFGVAGVATTMGVVFAVQTVNARDDFNETPTSATRDGFYRTRLLANTGFVIAGVAAIAGVVLWIMTPRDARVAPTAQRTGLLHGRVDF